MSEPQSIKFAHCDFIARHVRATVVVEVILFCMGREHRWRSPQRCFVVTSTFGNVCEIASMVVPSDINRPLSSYSYNFRAHTGIKSLSREHEGTLTQTELAIIMQIPLSAKPWFPPVGGIFGAGGTPLGKCRTPFRLIKINWGFCFIKAPEFNAWAGGAAQNCGV